MRRRDLIRLSAAAAALPAMGACAAQLPDARAAWRNPGAGETDPRRYALAWAILAPNPHNMQPWLADLHEPGVITLSLDPARLLPMTDPFGRQITIGAGAFLELLRMAAAAIGWRASAEALGGEAKTLPTGAPLARVRFEPGASPDPLFVHALARRTNRENFDARPVAQAVAEAVAAAAQSELVQSQTTVLPAQLMRLANLAAEASVTEAHTPAAHGETCQRTFIGAEEVARHRYGISLEGPLIEVAHATGLLTRRTMATPGSFAYRQTIAMLTGEAQSARGFLWLTTPGDERADQIRAGAAYLRANLAATGLGLAMQPQSQALQEYRAMASAYAQAHQQLAPSGGRVQMLARLGYAASPRPAPRRGLSNQIV
ncbi:MAG: Acg family FMN-binding oxidoreductase [Caulobacterales bacterium]